MTYKTQHLDNPRMLKWVTSLDSLLSTMDSNNETNLPDLSRACRVGGHRVDLSLPTGEAPSVRGEDGLKFTKQSQFLLWSLCSGLWTVFTKQTQIVLHNLCNLCNLWFQIAKRTQFSALSTKKQGIPKKQTQIKPKLRYLDYGPKKRNEPKVW
jgi:hypothetical protein